MSKPQGTNLMMTSSEHLLCIGQHFTTYDVVSGEISNAKNKKNKKINNRPPSKELWEVCVDMWCHCVSSNVSSYRLNMHHGEKHSFHLLFFTLCKWVKIKHRVCVTVCASVFPRQTNKNSLPSVVMHRVTSIPCTSDDSDAILKLTGIEGGAQWTDRPDRSLNLSPTTPPSVRSYG